MLTCMVLSVERTWLGAHTNASMNRLKMKLVSMDPGPKIPEKRKVRARGGGSSSVNRISLILYRCRPVSALRHPLRQRDLGIS